MTERLTINILSIGLALWIGLMPICTYAQQQVDNPTTTYAGKPKKGKTPKKRKKSVADVPQALRPSLPADEQRRFDYYFLEAMRQSTAKQYDAAYGLFEHCLGIDPHSAVAMYELANICNKLKLYDRAIALLRQAIELQPDNYWYANALVDIYLQRGNAEQAAAQLEEITVRFPKKTDPLYSLMGLYDHMDRMDLVLDVLNRMEARVGKSEQLSRTKSRIYLQNKDYDNALREVQALVDEYPYDSSYRLALADVLMSCARNDEARDILRQVLDEEPDNASAMYSLAQYYQSTGQTDLYEQQVDSLLLNRKAETETKVSVMRQLIIANNRPDGDSLRVTRVLDRMMEQEPGEAEIPMLYAQYLLAQGMRAKAMPVLRMALALDPTSTYVRLTLLSEAIKVEDYADIEELSRKGTETNPDSPEFYFYLAICYNRDERHQDVIDVCQAALDHMPTDATAELVSEFYGLMGDTYHEMGLDDQAYQAYEEAIGRNPNNNSALNNYAYYLSLNKQNLDKAEEMSYRTIKAEPANATYLDTYAWILFEKGEYIQARLYIEEAMKTNNDESLEIIEHAGDIYSATGDTDKAVEMWQRAKALGSESKTLDQKIERRQYVPNP